MRSTLLWWAKLVGVLLLPFLLITGMWEAALLVPGRVKVEHWRIASSFAFLATIFPVVVLLHHSRFRRFYRGALGMFVLAFLLYAAFVMQLRSNCGDEAVFIGGSPNTLVAQCD